MLVDLVASQPHYLEHLAPVWRALDPSERGNVLVPVELAAAAIQHLGYVVNGMPGDVRLAAGWSDVQGPPNRQRRVLMEHGIGQRYEGTVSPHYVGGSGERRVVDLFLLPNELAASHQDGEVAVIGSAYLDELRAAIVQPESPRVFDVATSFHFDTDLMPEASSAFRWFQSGVLKARDEDVRIVGHGHPRAWPELRRWYEDHRITCTSRFELVVQMVRAYACDNSSTMYYAAALGLPVVVMNSPMYRPGIHHGLRFWDMADVGEQVRQPSELSDAIKRAVDDPEKDRARRDEICAELFPYDDGGSAARAVAAMRDMFDQ